jgi:hypothetical protein
MRGKLLPASDCLPSPLPHTRPPSLHSSHAQLQFNLDITVCPPWDLSKKDKRPAGIFEHPPRLSELQTKVSDRAEGQREKDARRLQGEGVNDRECEEGSSYEGRKQGHLPLRVPVLHICPCHLSLLFLLLLQNNPGMYYKDLLAIETIATLNAAFCE